MCWKSETMLRDLPPDGPIEIWREGKPCLRTTARQLMRDGRFPGFMFIDQVEFAFGQKIQPDQMVSQRSSRK